MKRLAFFILTICILLASCSLQGGEQNPMPGEITGAPIASGLPQGTASPTPQAPGNSVAPNTPIVNTQTAFRFVVMGDSRGSDNGINSEIVKKIMERIKLLSPQPDFAIIPGDLVGGAGSYEGVKSQLEYFKKTVTAYYPAEFFYTCVGNHETSGVDGVKAIGEVFSEFKVSEFLEGYGRTVYYLDRGNARLFMLDTDYPGEPHEVSDKQLDWARGNLSKSGVNLFFMHEPPFPTGANVGYSLDKNTLQRAKLWELVDSSNDPMVFCCHEHNYTRRHINADFNTTVEGVDYKYGKTVYQVTTGGFGAPLYNQFTSKKDVDAPPAVEYNFVVVDVDGSKLSVKAYNPDGKQLDSFSN